MRSDGAGWHVEGALIRRRHVLYVEGYDPQGAEGYYNIFQRSLKRFLKIWPLKTELGPLTLDSEFLAHWDVDTAAPNWRVHTRYEFLRQEQFIRANMAEPMRRQVPRALWWTFDYIVTGTIYRILRVEPHYGLALLWFQFLMLAWLVAAAAGGALVWWALALFGLSKWLAGAAGAVVAVIAFKLFRPLADRWFVVQINSHWPYLCEFARGEPTCFDPAVNAGAERLVEIARANDVDEVLVVGHSGGGVMAPAVVAHALELDSNLGRHGPRIVLLTIGSIMPGAGMHPNARRLRAIIERIAVEQSILWIDGQAAKDALNFHDFDPVGGIGIDAGVRRCNPLVWQVRIRDMLADAFYRSLRWNFFRIHYQFIMANDMRAPYDYFMLVCGPFAPDEWAKRERALLSEFSEDGSYTSASTPAPAAR